MKFEHLFFSHFWSFEDAQDTAKKYLLVATDYSFLYAPNVEDIEDDDELSMTIGQDAVVALPAFRKWVAIREQEKETLLHDQWTPEIDRELERFLNCLERWAELDYHIYGGWA